MPEKKKVTEKPDMTCGGCGGNYTYFRRRTKDIVCRKCGHVTRLPRNKKKGA